jgi:hypothetical protein
MLEQGLFNIDCFKSSCPPLPTSAEIRSQLTASSLLKQDAPGNSGCMSVDAVPFVPRLLPGTGTASGDASRSISAIQTCQDLHATLASTTSCEQLLALLVDYTEFVNESCIIAALQRLVTLTITGGKAPAAAAQAAMQIAHLSAGIELTVAVTAAVMQGMLALDAELAMRPLTEVVRSTAERLQQQHTPHPRIFSATVAALRHMTPVASSEVLVTACTDLGHCASLILARTPLPNIPPDAIQELAYMLLLNNLLLPELVATLGHAACIHASCLPAASIVLVLQLLVACHSTDSNMLGLLARSFHDNNQVGSRPLHASVAVLLLSLLLLPKEHHASVRM